MKSFWEVMEFIGGLSCFIIYGFILISFLMLVKNTLVKGLYPKNLKSVLLPLIIVLIMFFSMDQINNFGLGLLLFSLVVLCAVVGLCGFSVLTKIKLLIMGKDRYFWFSVILDILFFPAIELNNCIRKFIKRGCIYEPSSFPEDKHLSEIFYTIEGLAGGILYSVLAFLVLTGLFFKVTAVVFLVLLTIYSVFAIYIDKKLKIEVHFRVESDSDKVEE